eukprot:Selendium_serpulae@DN5758_c0_g1_i17.p1
MPTAQTPPSRLFQWQRNMVGMVPLKEEFCRLFFLGYGITQSIGGWLADKHGGKLVLLMGLIMWSIFTALVPFFAHYGTVSACCIRMALGLGEGVGFPAIHSMIAHYIHPSSLSTIVALVTSGSYIGAFLALILTPKIITSFGWRAAFWAFACMSLPWIPVWLFFNPSSGRFDTKPSLVEYQGLCVIQEAGEADDGEDDDQQASMALAPFKGMNENCGRRRSPPLTTIGKTNLADQKIREGSRENLDPDADTCGSENDEDDDEREESVFTTVRYLLAHKAVWAIIICQYCQSFGMYGVLNWFPTYLSKLYDVDVADLSSYTALPYLFQGLVALGSGWFADWLIYDMNTSKLRVRQVLQVGRLIDQS